MGVRVLLCLAAAGCLDAPPAALPADDPAVCTTTFIDDGFGGVELDGDLWLASFERSSFVVAGSGNAELYADGADLPAYAEIASVMDAEQTDMILVAELSAGLMGKASFGLSLRIEGMVSFDIYKEEDSPRFAARRGEFGDFFPIPTESEVEFSPDQDHALRLRVAGDLIYFEATPTGGDWQEVAQQPLRDGLYHAVLWVFNQDAESFVDLRADRVSWLGCQ